MVECYTFVGPTLLIERENFSIAFFQELNMNIQTNVLWPSRMKKILITVESSMCMSRRPSFSSSSSPWFEKISLLHPCYLLRCSYQSLRYPKHTTIGYLEVSIQNNVKNLSNYNVSYAQTCCRTKIKLTLALTNRKCRRNWFKTTQNGEQNNPLGIAKKGSLETKFEETAGQMTVGHIRSYKFVRFGLKGLMS